MPDNIAITVVEDVVEVVTLVPLPTVAIRIPEEVIQVVEISSVGPRGPQGPAGGYQYLDAGGNANFARPTEGGPWVWGNTPSMPVNIDPQDLWIDSSS